MPHSKRTCNKKARGLRTLNQGNYSSDKVHTKMKRKIKLAKIGRKNARQ